MNKRKITKLKKQGWQVGSASDFLGLSKEEAAYIELKLALARKLQKKRISKKLTQEKLAEIIHSSQSRVAKMEKNDPTVSLDLMIRTLLVLGSTRAELARAIA